MGAREVLRLWKRAGSWHHPPRGLGTTEDRAEYWLCNSGQVTSTLSLHFFPSEMWVRSVCTQEHLLHVLGALLGIRQNSEQDRWCSPSQSLDFSGGMMRYLTTGLFILFREMIHRMLSTVSGPSGKLHKQWPHIPLSSRCQYISLTPLPSPWTY